MNIHENKQKVLFVTVFHSLVSKNILNTDALIKLRDSGRYKIVLLVPEIKKSFFETHYSHENVVIEGIEMQVFENGTIENFFQTCARLLIDTHYLHYKRIELLDSNKSLIARTRHFIREMIVSLFADRQIFLNIFRACDSWCSQKNNFQIIFDTYRPDLVFSTDIFEQMGTQLLREAKLRKIKTVGMVRSWDNCLSKGLLRVKPERILVNNEVIKQELSSIHGVDELCINVVGLPQFDRFVTDDPISKEEFFKSNGLDINKRLVMFAPGGKVLSDTDPDICAMLIEARKNGLLPTDIQFFVRNHPQHPADLELFKNQDGVVIQSPGKVLDPTTHKETELTPHDQDFLRNILAHTDVLIWVATSLCLDALVYDVPQVVLNFDGYSTKDYYHSVKRYHDEDHMKKMFVHKPFCIANNTEELIAGVALYLSDRTIDQKERCIVKSQQLFTLDGKSGERIAKILDYIVSQDSVS